MPLLFIPLSSVWFYILYLFCGFTDMIDGTIARKTGAVSKFGAKLDTVADFVFVFVCMAKILPRVYLPVWLWAWIIMIAIMKMFHIAWVFIRKKRLLSIHSVLNKMTGLALFLLPPTLTLIEPVYSVATICAFATLATMQEVYFTAKGQKVFL